HLLKGPEHEDFTLYSSTPFGKARQRSKPGQGRRNSAPPTRMRARTSRSTWTIPNSRASRCARLCVGARLRSPSSGATPHCPAWVVKESAHLTGAGHLELDADSRVDAYMCHETIKPVTRDKRGVTGCDAFRFRGRPCRIIRNRVMSGRACIA